MSDAPLEERLAAVERALTDGDESVPDPSVPADLADRVETLEADVAELEAAVQAVRGYVGSVKHVNDEVEQRADAAMAKAEAVERSLADGADDDTPATPTSAPGGCPRCGAGRRAERAIPVDRRPGEDGGPANSDGPPAPPDPQSPPEDRGADGRPQGDPDSGRVGHRSLEAPDEAEGLIERLREVL